MRLVFIHGRAQGSSSSEKIEEDWLRAVKIGCTKSGAQLPSDLDIRVPFYGKYLDEATAGTQQRQTVSRGDGPQNSFEAETILALAKQAGISVEEITAEMQDPEVLRGPENWRLTLAAMRLLSRRAPYITESYIRKFTADVHTYLTRPKVQQQVNTMISEALGEGPAVMIGHSLGSVVAYCTLAFHKSPPTVPLLVTVGSPLGIPTIKSYLPKPLGPPPGVKVWYNASDKRDPVALFPRLEREHFPAEVINTSDVKNPKEDAHGIAGYLSDQFVAGQIAAALSRE
ncbi:hypothetical protein [Streptomyces sp. NPDC051364]|uniref:hypothetical protein n=1 Tax=Streptomyces sp. NPDC051364 TaxID=3155799 RepID=UPI003433CB06